MTHFRRKVPRVEAWLVAEVCRGPSSPKVRVLVADYRCGHEVFPIHLLRSIAISAGAAAEFSGAPISRFCSRRRARSSRDASEDVSIGCRGGGDAKVRCEPSFLN